MPTIFTNTPYEAYIQAVFLQAQIAVARLINGTPVFRVLLFAVLAWSIVLTFVRMASQHHHSAGPFVHIVYRIGMVFLAMGLLSWQSTSAQWSAPSGAAWSSMTGVRGDVRYDQTLNRATPGLRWYFLAYESLNGMGQGIINAAGAAFSDPALTQDPSFLPKQLARMSAMALSPDTHRALDALNRTCADTNTGKVIGRRTSLRELYDMSLPGCDALWTSFDTNAQRDMAELADRYPAYVWTKVHMSLSNRFGLMDENRNRGIAFANALHASLQNQAGFDNYGKFANMGNLSANSAATLSSNGDRFVEEQSKGLLSGWILGAGDAIANWFGGPGTFQQSTRKAEAANKFNMLAPLIPPARAFIQGVLSILFVLAAYAVGFGTWRPMYAWIMAEASVCLYRPAAVIGYKAAVYFTQEAKLSASMADLVNDPYLIGGALYLQNQLAELQTVYVCFEIGMFVTCVLGAIAAFRPLSAMTGAAGLAIAGQVAGVAQMVATRGMAGGAAGGTSVAVNVQRSAAVGSSLGGGPGGPSGGGGLAGMAREGLPSSNEPAMPGGTRGIITPAAQAPKTWGDVA